MHKTNLHQLGGDVMPAVPPELVKLLQMKPGATVAVDIEGGQPIVESEAEAA